MHPRAPGRRLHDRPATRSTTARRAVPPVGPQLLERRRELSVALSETLPELVHDEAGGRIAARVVVLDDHPRKLDHLGIRHDDTGRGGLHDVHSLRALAPCLGAGGVNTVPHFVHDRAAARRAP